MTTTQAKQSRSVRTWELVRVLAVREFRTRYRQSVLEVAWSLITPIVLLTVYGIVLTQVFDVQAPGVPYLSFVWTGMVVWMMFSSGVGNGVRSIIGNADLIGKVYFPREALPLAVVGASIFDLLIGCAVLVPLVAIQITDVSIAVVAVVPILAVVVVWTAAVTAFVAALAVFVRDIVHAVVLALQAGFFLTPVMYPPDAVPENLQFIMTLNPLAVCITALRSAVLFQSWPDWSDLALTGLVGLVVFSLVIAYVRSVEDRMVDVV